MPAGKLRRYHDDSLLRKFLDVKTNILNVKDVFRTFAGIIQSWSIIGKLKPDALFAKGGFVSVPVGIAAHIKGVKFLTHDSDAVPGLANRIIGRWAEIHATGLPKELYSYPSDKTEYVGVPVSKEFVLATDELVSKAREELGIPVAAKVLFVTGGSQGSARINTVIATIAKELLADENVYLIHHTGKQSASLYGDVNNSRLIISEFFDNFSVVATAADIIVTRAGANSMTEFGLLGKAIVVIPSPFLTGGHQLENAKQLSIAGAIEELDETTVVEDPGVLLDTLNMLINDDKRRNKLGVKLNESTKPDAAKHLAQLVLSMANKS